MYSVTLLLIVVCVHCLLLCVDLLDARGSEARKLRLSLLYLQLLGCGQFDVSGDLGSHRVRHECLRLDRTDGATEGHA